MHIKRIKKKDSVYLAQYESYRENGKVKTRFIKYLGKEGDERGVPLPKKSAHIETPLYPEHSKRAGDVQLMWSIADSTLNRLFLGRTGRVMGGVEQHQQDWRQKPTGRS